ncbi:alpha/beta hydrolase [bacterium]|nr:alpha/beta hydrolase [bacterium]
MMSIHLFHLEKVLKYRKNPNIMNWKKIRKIIRIVWIFTGLTFTAWLFISFQPQNFDIASVLESNQKIVVENSNQTISFIPVELKKNIKIIFYPGGMVDPRAYAPLTREIALNGYSVYILKLPWRSAPLQSYLDQLFDRTNALIQDDPADANWVISGHSKGAALAAKFVKRHPHAVDALLLIATSHPKNTDTDLANIKMPVLKISASEDGLASREEIEKNQKFLPQQTEYYEIQGGNHGQFGYYGSQLGDHKASISRDVQQQETLEVILDFLERISVEVKNE